MVSVFYPNTDNHDPAICGRSQIQKKEFERVTSFINNHPCNPMQVRPDAVQSLKPESTLVEGTER